MKLEEFKSKAQVARNEKSQNYSLEIVEGADLVLNAIAGEGDILPKGELALVMAILLQDDQIVKQDNGSDSKPRAYVMVPNTKMMISYSSFRHYAGIASVKFDVVGNGKSRKLVLDKGFQIKRKPELSQGRYDWRTAEAVAID